MLKTDEELRTAALNEGTRFVIDKKQRENLFNAGAQVVQNNKEALRKALLTTFR